MSDNKSSELASQAKAELLKQYQKESWFNGAGIVPSSSGFGLRLNAKKGMEAAVLASGLPESFQGFPLEVLFVEYTST